MCAKKAFLKTLTKIELCFNEEEIKLKKFKKIKKKFVTEWQDAMYQMEKEIDILIKVLLEEQNIKTTDQIINIEKVNGGIKINMINKEIDLSAILEKEKNI